MIENNNYDELDLIETKDDGIKSYVQNISLKIKNLIVNENIEPKDIMILVQRRNPFAGLFVSELKSLNIDVAGSDRIVLPDFPAIKDLLNIIRFCINPMDDYSLCCTLKSPIYRLTELDIFNLCKEREGLNIKDKKGRKDEDRHTVFEVLEKNHPEIHLELTGIIEDYKKLAPYTFFSKLLNENSRREKIISALGIHVIDPIEEFLTICLSYERTNPGTLKHFLKWFITSSAEIKRDMESESGVRIVTVHGSKGLEAPIIFLVDTVRSPKDKSEKVLSMPQKLLFDNEINISDEEAFADRKIWLWANKNTNSEDFEKVKEFELNIKMEEYYRLLYVAMTRARDRLYIYGYTPYKKEPEFSWHTELHKIMQTIEGAMIDAEETIRIEND